MNILNSLAEIRKNQSNFKKWEEEQGKTDAKRRYLAQNKPATEQELKNAKELGKTIIDVVDIMDQHSEDVAENVETATALPQTILPFATLFGGFWASIKFLIKPGSKKLDKLKEDFIKENKAELESLVKEVSENSPKQKFIYEGRFLNKNDVKSLNLSGDLLKRAELMAGKWSKISRRPIAKITTGIVAPLLASIVAFVAGNVYSTKMQVGGSRVARFQARKMLEDPKYFVKYTPEQIAQAKEILAAEDDKTKKKKKKKLKSGMFKSIFNVLKDQKEYKNWKQTYNDTTQKVNRPLSAKELIKAKKDQEIIQRVVREVNNNAEKYSENMEVAADVIIGGTPLLGIGVGWVVGAVVNKLKLMDNYVKNLVKKVGSPEAQEAYEVLLKTDEKAPNRKRVFRDFKSKLFYSTAKEEERLLKSQKSALRFNKFKAYALSTKQGRNMVLGAIGYLVTGVVGALISLRLQKASARAGRYIAKQELEKDPHNFIGYTQEELDKAKEAPRKDKKPSKFKETITFLPTVIGQYFEYNKYKKGELKEQKELQEALLKVEISNSQLKEAKNLQRKVFNTFEKVDDNSQQYSESVEMAAETATPFVWIGGLITIASPVIFGVIQAIRGKLTVKSVTNKIIKILSGATWITKSKLFKKYLTGVAKNLPYKVQNAKTQSTVLKRLFSEADVKAMLAKKGDLKVKEVCDALIKGTEKLDDKEIPQLIDDLRHTAIGKKMGLFSDLSYYDSMRMNKQSLQQLLESIKMVAGEKRVLPVKMIDEVNNLASGKTIDELVKKLNSKTDKEVEVMMNNLANDLSDIRFMRSLDLGSVDRTYLLKTLPKIQTIIKNVPKDEFKLIVNTLIEEFDKNPDEFVKLMGKDGIKNIFFTKELKRAFLAAGIVWAGANIAIIYAISAWIADIQLKAGRLGVMKAIESLQDPAYYANIEPENQELSQNKTGGNLLKNKS